jgi:hypothetical protein
VTRQDSAAPRVRGLASDAECDTGPAKQNFLLDEYGEIERTTFEHVKRQFFGLNSGSSSDLAE